MSALYWASSSLQVVFLKNRYGFVKVAIEAGAAVVPSFCFGQVWYTTSILWYFPRQEFSCNFKECSETCISIFKIEYRDISCGHIDFLFFLWWFWALFLCLLSSVGEAVEVHWTCMTLAVVQATPQSFLWFLGVGLLFILLLFFSCFLFSELAITLLLGHLSILSRLTSVMSLVMFSIPMEKCRWL